ncbi:MAG: hypothetical protein E6G98_00295 [Bacillati bacterium ANGP1]|uniref:Uncharacterized protein n=1 Tax=Candidatus Segetimicrobium genomatis TaxID=2569760 RepID=A0A537M0Y4_9BACT|nr:MAG: hypothetical protein E6G98_00295 [Terrabacteria group bacterium ANGP1]
MESLVLSFITLLAGDKYSNGDHERITIIVPRTHADVVDLLAKAFAGREGVEIIVDRRHSERRAQQRAVAVERRRADRRRPRDTVIEVVLGAGTRPHPPSAPA